MVDGAFHVGESGPVHELEHLGNKMRYGRIRLSLAYYSLRRCRSVLKIPALPA